MKEKIAQILQERGLRVTPQRRIIINILERFPGHLSAEEIYAEVGKENPEISCGTIYRNLSILHDAGVIRDLYFNDGKVRYEMNNKIHHHHLVCIQCGETIELERCPMDKHITKVAKENNFVISGHSFEVFGTCNKCQKGDEKC